MDTPPTTQPSDSDFQLKAGGLVWDSVRGNRRLLLVHRIQQRDWTLPKGKRESKDDSLLATAQREVREEGGVETRVLGFAGSMHYNNEKGLNIVLYWNLLRTGRFSGPPQSPPE